MRYRFPPLSQFAKIVIKLRKSKQLPSFLCFSSSNWNINCIFASANALVALFVDALKKKNRGSKKKESNHIRRTCKILTAWYWAVRIYVFMKLPSFCRVNFLISVIFSANSFFIFKILSLKSMVGYINMILLNILLIYA